MEIIFEIEKELDYMKKMEMFRLVADEGMILTNGEVKASVVDVLADRIGEWSEVQYVESEEEK